MEERIEKLERLIPKLKANKKILPLRIECLEWELRALKAEKQIKNIGVIGDVSECFCVAFEGVDDHGSIIKGINVVASNADAAVKIVKDVKMSYKVYGVSDR